MKWQFEVGMEDNRFYERHMHATKFNTIVYVGMLTILLICRVLYSNYVFYITFKNERRLRRDALVFKNIPQEILFEILARLLVNSI